MIKSELNRIAGSVKGRVGLALILAMPTVDLLIHIFDDVILYGDFGAYHLNHPVYAGFLCGSAIGKLPQILFFWLLPLYFLVLYSDTVFDDAKYGYGVSLMSRTGRKGYFKAKFTIAFCLPFALVFAELVVNLFFCVLLFHRGYQFGGYEDYYASMGVWFAFGIKHPYLYYAVYIITSSLICGLSGVLGLCSSLLFKSRYVAYFFAFFVWLVQIILPFGIGHTVQPYVEGGFGQFMSGLAIFAASVLALCVVVYCARVRKDGLS